MYIVYALQFKDRIYVGITSDLSRRLAEHSRGKTKSTKNRGEFTVLYIEECDNRINAREREKYWKSGCGKEKLKQLRTISSVG
ncbi:GIY-YIG nuclease family protein [Candidatus Falkowbacteria bacterium]|nr:GIY-YIG nuclease family protein [Candidatus Falkowbacteria bacterium]